MIYFDNASTTKISEHILKNLDYIFKNYFANSASLHKLGYEVEQKIINVKTEIANYLNVKANEIYFTSGGTESNNLAIFGVANAYKKKGLKIITSCIEHKSVLNPFKKLEELGFEVYYINVDKKGYIDKNKLFSIIDEKTTLVSLVHINSEIGTIQDISNISKQIKKINDRVIIHVDAVQSFGKILIDTTNIDLLSISAHKIHALKGVGAIYVKDKVKLNSLIFGGGQQVYRAGTLNNEAIICFGIACKHSFENIDKNFEKVLKIKQEICKIKNLIDGVFINGDEENGSPYILSLSFLDIKGEVLLHALEQKNIFVSTGSACNSKNKKELTTLDYINKDIKDSTIRLSFSYKNTLEEAKAFIDAILEIVPMLRMYKKR